MPSTMPSRFSPSGMRSARSGFAVHETSFVVSAVNVRAPSLTVSAVFG